MAAEDHGSETMGEKEVVVEAVVLEVVVMELVVMEMSVAVTSLPACGNSRNFKQSQRMKMPSKLEALMVS